MNILDAIGQTTIDKVQSERPVPRFEAGDSAGREFYGGLRVLGGGGRFFRHE